MPYPVRELLRGLAKRAMEAKRMNHEEVLELLPPSFGSHAKEKHPWLKEGIEKVERVVGARIFVSNEIGHIQHFRSPQGISIVALSPDTFLEILEQGRHSLHGNLARILVEKGKEVPEEEDWIEAHRRTLQSIMRGRGIEASNAAHEYLSHVLAGAAAHELLGGKASVPDELRDYVSTYREALKEAEREALENLAKYYLQFIEAAKRLGFHTY